MRFLTLSLIFVVARICTPVEGRVFVQVGHWLQPLLNRRTDAIVLENRDIVFQLKCLAPYPTEWVYDDDDQHPNAAGRLRVEWSDRKFQHSIDESVYDYIAWIQLQYQRMIEGEVLVCRAVADHSDQIRVSLQPNNNHEVQITMAKHGDENAEDFAVPAVRTRPEGEVAPECETRLFVISTKNGVYWKCEVNKGQSKEPEHGSASLTFYACRPSAAHCANTFRVIKQLDKCATVFNNAHDAPVPVAEIEQTWSRMPADRARIPGVAVCSPTAAAAGDGVESRRAVEYYFNESELGPGSGDGSGPAEIHFLWPPAAYQPKDLIRIKPSPALMKPVYYTDDSLHVTCTVPKYGFAFDPVFTVTRNGSRLLLERGFSEDFLESVYWTKAITIQFANYGPGEYELNCIAPVWNTTEWATQARTVTVLESKHITNTLHKGQEQIIDKLDTIGQSLQKMGIATAEHSKNVQAMLEKLIMLQERQLAIAERVLATANRAGSGAGVGFGTGSKGQSTATTGTIATGPIPVSEIKNQLQSGRNL